MSEMKEEDFLSDSGVESAAQAYYGGEDWDRDWYGDPVASKRAHDDYRVRARRAVAAYLEHVRSRPSVRDHEALRSLQYFANAASSDGAPFVNVATETLLHGLELAWALLPEYMRPGADADV